jgi:hypothetical protein
VSELFEALRRVVEIGRIEGPPLQLEEPGKGNKCDPIPIVYSGDFFALRLDNDHLRVLAGSKEDPDKSFRKLPDYLVFGVPKGARKAKADPDLYVLLCELKSSDKGAESAKRQIQLGRFFAEYLVRVASFGMGRKAPPSVHYRGAIARPTPANIRPKGKTRPGAIPDYDTDDLADLMIFKIPGGEELRLETVFW